MSTKIFLSHLSRTGSTLLADRLESGYHLVALPEAKLPRFVYGLRRIVPTMGQPTLGMGSSPLTTADDIKQLLSLLWTTTQLGRWGFGAPPDEVGGSPNLSASLPDAFIEFLDTTATRLPLTAPQIVDALMDWSASINDGQIPTMGGSPPSPSTDRQEIPVLHKGDPVMPWVAAKVQAQFPGSIVLYTMRDPRAMYVSQRHGNMQLPERPFSRRAAVAATEWARSAKAILAHQEQTNSHGSCVVVKYEDLITAPEPTLTAASGQLGLSPRHAATPHSPVPPSEGFLSRVDLTEVAALHQLVAGEVQPARAEAWRTDISSADQSVIEQICGPLMETFGYRRTARPGPPAWSRPLSEAKGQIATAHERTQRRRERSSAPSTPTALSRLSHSTRKAIKHASSLYRTSRV